MGNISNVESAATITGLAPDCEGGPVMAIGKTVPFREGTRTVERWSLQAVFRVVKLFGNLTAVKPVAQRRGDRARTTGGMMRYSFSNYPSFFDTNIRRANLGMG